jgi:hypothetical protein
MEPAYSDLPDTLRIEGEWVGVLGDDCDRMLGMRLVQLRALCALACRLKGSVCGVTLYREREREREREKERERKRERETVCGVTGAWLVVAGKEAGAQKEAEADAVKEAEPDALLL